jgi:regulator of cell morphogenesis and NO signaling
MVRALEQPEADASAAAGQGPGLAGPVQSNAREHESAGRALARLRELTGDFQPPADACPTFRGMLDRLHQLEQDTHRHVHKENNILFARALRRGQ